MFLKFVCTVTFIDYFYNTKKMLDDTLEKLFLY